MSNAPNASENISDNAPASPDSTKGGSLPESHEDVDEGKVRDPSAAAANASSGDE